MPQPGVVINGFIAVDKFPKDAAIKYYFLTHAHSDHYASVDVSFPLNLLFSLIF